MTVEEAGRLLADAVETGDPDLLREFAETGRDGLLALRAELRPPGGGRWVVGRNRDRMENMSGAVAAIAARWPDDFLAVFDAGFDDGPDTYVLAGLGAIRDQRATERLLAATRASHQEARREAALWLTGRPSRATTDALVRLLDDPLAQGEALWALARTGDATALPALRSFCSSNRYTNDLAEFAADEIEGRHPHAKHGGGTADAETTG